jgi:hypothetical protein
MVVEAKPFPIMTIGYSNGARTPGEDALFRRIAATDRQTKIINTHAGGGQIIVPQLYTGSGSDGQLNEHIKNINKALMEHQANSEFDDQWNSTKIGGRKRKSSRKTKKTVRKTRKHTRTRRIKKNKSRH